MMTTDHIDKEKNINKKGISVVWKNLSVVAECKEQSIFKKTKKSYKRIIHDVTGAIFPGNLVAILGASGSGKTTLMSVLANRNPGGLQIQGDIRVNGRSDKEFLKQASGYVYQNDLFIPTLTVMEHLNFTAKLRLDENVGEGERNALILKVLSEVGLLELANGFIGSHDSREKMNLSGGERKRLSVASELLIGSQLLFCDEPTTGLDSFSSFKLITMMQNLVINSHKTVVCTIHQPNRQIFEIFQQIVLLSDGHIVFNGSSNDAIKFFKGQGYEYNDEQNPAEYFISSIADNRRNEHEKNCEFFLHDDYLRSEYFQNMREYANNAMKQKNAMEFFVEKSRPPSSIRKLKTVTYRSCLNMIRISSQQNIVLISKIILAIFVGACVRGTVKKNQLGVSAFKCVSWIIINNNFMSTFASVLPYFPNEMKLFYGEYSNDSVPPFVFYVANTIAVFSRILMENILYTIVIYFFADPDLDTSFFAVITSLIVLILLVNASAALGITFSIFSPNVSLAYTYAYPVLQFSLICNGLFAKLSSLPFLLSWIQYVSIEKSAVSAIYIIYFKDVHHIKCETNPDVPCFKNGLEVLKNFDYDEDSLCYDMIMLLLFSFIIHIIAYLCLLNRIKKRIV